MQSLVKKIKSSDSSICDSIIDVFEYINKNFKKDSVQLDLNEKIEKIKLNISNQLNCFYKLKKLLHIFYIDWKYGSATGLYKISDVLWIDKVLQNKKGTALSLGIILMHIANKLQIKLIPIIFPTQLILQFKNKDSKKNIFINPFNGEIISKNLLDLWLKGHISSTTFLDKKDLKEVNSFVLICKILNSLKLALIEEKKLTLALKISNVLVEINPQDPYEIRDRGLIYSHLDCNHIAVSDLIYFIEHCPEDPLSEIIKMQVHMIQKKKNIFH
ncbi:tetratricopeptide repeat protein [Buchnera aphidicola (Kurisakia onigurumii)]|uniref:transglutaminase family protein n=1 Tax=Buchnera aphidicola TaxID=9 RepID=UPI0031B6B0CB